MRFGAFVVSCSGISLAVASALADEPPPTRTARLEYEAPQGCPPASVLGGEFARRLGVDPFVDASPLLVVARITREKAVLAGSLELYGAAGTSLWSTSATPTTDCQALVVEMGSALAYRFDPTMFPTWPPGEPPPPPPPPPPLPPPPPPPKQEPRPVQQDPPVRAPAPGRVLLGITPQLALSKASTSGSLVGALGWRWPFLPGRADLSVALEARFDAPSSVRVDDIRAGASVRAQLFGGALLVCINWPHVFGCVLGSGGELTASASGLDGSWRQGGVLGFLGVGARLGLEETLLPWLSVRAYGEALYTRSLVGRINGDEVRGPSLLSFPVVGAIGAGLVVYLDVLR